MRSRLPLFVVFVLIFTLIDFYNLGGLRLLVAADDLFSIVPIYIVLCILGYIGIYLGLTLWRQSPLKRSKSVNLLIGFAFVMMITRLTFGSLLFIQDVWRLLESGIAGLGLELIDSDHSGFFVPRRKVLTSISLFVSLIPFVGMLYGITKGKYNFKIEKITLYFPDLPSSFDGYKIIQISDIHAGSWDDIRSVSKGVDKIKSLSADMIVFTGDLVNSDKNEIDPFLDLFGSLKAKDGIYAILGNHDYYGQPRDITLRPAYYAAFFEKFKIMGWDLVMNDHRIIKRGRDHISLVGVENWGLGRYFPKRGDLEKALIGVDKEDFTILLSHDPTHWDEKVVNHDKFIHLTLSGHTHGMQFGINSKFLKWSPIQFRYKKWIGLYEEKKQLLYVNRGLGYLAFPGRVGMSPEITVLTLKKGLEP